MKMFPLLQPNTDSAPLLKRKHFYKFFFLRNYLNYIKSTPLTLFYSSHNVPLKDKFAVSFLNWYFLLCFWVQKHGLLQIYIKTLGWKISTAFEIDSQKKSLLFPFSSCTRKKYLSAGTQFVNKMGKQNKIEK